MRLFLASQLPVWLLEKLGREQEILKEQLKGWRWVKPENIHLTLKFLGEVERGNLPTHIRAWGRIASGCPAGRFSVSGAGVFPSPGKPRVLWAGIREQIPGGFLSVMAREFDSQSESLGFAPENRRFTGHLTLARASRRGKPQAPDRSAIAELGEVSVEEVVLFRSDLEPGGARYTVLERFPLAERKR